MRWIPLALLVLASAGCAKTTPASIDQGSPSEQEQVPAADAPHRPTVPIEDSCEAIRGATFKSIEEFDTGLGPDGRAAMGKLTIEFRDGVMRYQVADAFDSAAYVCANGEITGGEAGQEFHLLYDGVEDRLTWNSHEYERVK